jgi:hypothetical protein
VVWKWGLDQEVAFQTLQAKMCDALVLRQPDFEKKFFLQTDVSAYGMGAVLSQEHSGEGEKPRRHPITYFLATFTLTERNYDIYKRELLAIIKALHHW